MVELKFKKPTINQTIFFILFYYLLLLNYILFLLLYFFTKQMHLRGRNWVLTPSIHCRSPNQPRCRSRYHEIKL